MFGLKCSTAAIALLAVTSATVIAQEANAVDIDIKKQTLTKALKEFSDQTHIQLVYSQKQLEGLVTAGASGHLNAQTALSQILDGTDFILDQVDDTTYAIRSESTAMLQRTSARGGAKFRNIAEMEGENYSANLAAYEEDERADEVVGTDSRFFDEIIVTAQQKEQSIMDVPISITVLGVNELESLRVDGIEDYAFSVPGVSFSRSSRFNPTIAIRAITGASGGQYTPIGTTIDDIAYGSVDSATILSARSLDIERIEILRGPQGTLTGANSLGGTINIITAKPNTEAFTAKVTLDYGRYNTKMVKGVVNVPLSEDLAVRVLASMEQGDGAVTNLENGQTSSTDNFATRVAVRWQPSDKLTIDADFTYDRQRYGLGNVLYTNRYENDLGRQSAIDLYIENGGNIIDPAVKTIEEVGTNGGFVRYDFRDYDEFDSWWSSFRVNYDMGDHKLDLIYGHYDFQHNRGFDDDQTPFPISILESRRFNNADSIELRVTSAYDSTFNWVAGVNYHDERNPYDSVGRLANSTDGAYTELWFKFDNSEILKNFAVYANVFWDITDKLHLSSGVRYTKVNAQYGEQCCGDFGAADPLSVPLAPIVHAQGKSNEINPRIALNYDITDSATVYVQFATGYRAGYGNDGRLTGLPGVPERVEGEDVRNYEIGLKSFLFDNRLSINAAAYIMDYTNLQTFGGEIDLGDGEEIGYDINAGEADMKGFEIEMAAHITENLQLRGSLSHVDSGISEVAGIIFDPAIGFPNVRSWSGKATAIYNREVNNDVRVFVRSDYIWQNEAEANPLDPTPVSYLGAINTLDISAGVETEKWVLTAYMENVFNDIYWTGIIDDDRPVANFEPRMYGIRFTYNWGE
ncbi:MAG: TonB-dependent receptor [Kordiimonadaceae bacterium]|nr:TonB-dependent receptor [Kordiimonadaceae bacterium]